MDDGRTDRYLDRPMNGQTEGGGADKQKDGQMDRRGMPLPQKNADSFESLFLGFFKRGLINFSLNNFSRFQIFLDFIILSCYS